MEPQLWEEGGPARREGQWGATPGASYSQWGRCGRQRGSRTGAPRSASAGGGQTAPAEARGRGSLRATEGGSRAHSQAGRPTPRPESALHCKPGLPCPHTSGPRASYRAGLTHHQEPCPALHRVQLGAGHAAVVALVAVVQAVDDQAPVLYEVPGGGGGHACSSAPGGPATPCHLRSARPASLSCQNLPPQSGAPHPPWMRPGGLDVLPFPLFPLPPSPGWGWARTCRCPRAPGGRDHPHAR